MLLVFQNKTNIEIVGFYLIRFRFALDSSNIDMWMLDTHLDLLDTDIPGKHFVFLQDVLKTSSRHVFKTSSKHVLKTFSRRLQRNNFSSSKTSWETKNCHAEDESKTSSRNVLKTNKCLLGTLKSLAEKNYVFALWNLKKSYPS